MYHLGFGQVVAVSTITRADEGRSFQIYEDLFTLLIKEGKQLYLLEDNLEVLLKGNVLLLMQRPLIYVFLLFIGLHSEA